MDSRFSAIQPLIKKGTITTFSQIFGIIPASVLAKELKFNYNKMKRIVKNPAGLTVEECYRIAELIGVKGNVIMNLVEEEIKRIQ
jgi:plasmid maintenance system antidote protein VapI